MNNQGELRKYLMSLLSWWWLVIFFCAASAAASYLYSIQMEEVYEATATVIVGQSLHVTDPTTQDLDTSRQLAQTYALVIRKQPIMQAVINELGLNESWHDLRMRTTVYLVPTTQLIEITVKDRSPEVARRIADEIVRQFILFTPTLDSTREKDETQAFIQDRLKRLKEKIIARQAEIDQKEVLYLNAGLESERQAIELEIDRLEAMVGVWESNYSRLLTVDNKGEVSNYVAVIEPAQASIKPVWPDVRMNVIIASVVGLLLGFAIVYLLHYLDDTIKTEEELEQEAQLIPLGVVHQMDKKLELDKLITSQNPFSTAQEAFRMIRSNVQFLSVTRPSKTLMITSGSAGEGKSLTAANMSLAMAQAGLKTILVDADLRKPRQHRLFRISNHVGLTDLLTHSQLNLSRVLHVTSLENLQVLTSGTRPPNPTELLGSQRMVELLGELSEMADVVILDSMPVLPVADSVVLSNRVDGVILVVDSTITRRLELKKAIQVLIQADAKIWGAVLNRVPRKKIRYLAADFTPQPAKNSHPRSLQRREQSLKN
ncbi:MAG: polysaccharide biosynthesis tyrosine autokinase [Chloroflexi bacterium]|nr:polysaccharide biosynthesis tyrosine autokinase [Chloroflexota bacterium]